MRRKLRDLVVFSIEGLDLSRIVASDLTPNATGSETEEDGKSTKGEKEPTVNGKSNRDLPSSDDDRLGIAPIRCQQQWTLYDAL